MVRHSALGSLWRLELLSAQTPAELKRLVASVRLIAHLKSPYVLRLIDWLDVDGQPALLFEHLDAETLAERGTAGLSDEELLEIFSGVLRGLQAAHAFGIVHGALAASSVLLASDNTRRLTGFVRPLAVGRSPKPSADIYAACALLRWLFADRQIPQAVAGAIAAGMAPLPLRVPSIEALWEQLTGRPFPSRVAARPLAQEPVSLAALAFPQTVTSGLLPPRGRPVVGRAHELDAVLQQIVASPGLYTLAGPAGVGKTRLAVEIAHQLLQRAKSVLWVDLQAANTVEDALARVAWALGCAVAGAVDSLARSLAQRGPLLLVLDNIEQLLDAVEGDGLRLGDLPTVLCQLCAAAPELRLLSTSRQSIDVSAERLFEIQPLPVGADDPLHSDAWRLLVSASPVGALDGVTPALASSLLRELEGLPLALELAGGRLEVLQPEQLLERIGERFAVLSAPEPRAHLRYRGLYEALDASWRALSVGAQMLLASLSAFVGPFDLPSAHAIADMSDADLHLDQLIHRSLVGRAGNRLVLLVAVRQFASKQLAGEARREVLRCHARWFAKQSSRWRKSTPEVSRAIEGCASELAAILDRAEVDPAMVDDALRCVRALALLHLVRGPLGLLQQCLDRALSLPGGSLVERSHLHLYRSLARRRQGDLPGSLADARWVLDHAADLPGEHAVSACSQMSDLHDFEGRFEEALHTANQGASLAAVHRVTSLLPALELSAGSALAGLGRMAAARERYMRALSSVPEGDLVDELEVRRGIGWFELLVEDLEAARHTYERVVELAEALNNTRALLTAVAQLGLIAEAEGRLEEAQRSYRVAADGMTQWGDPTFVNYYRGMIGRVLIRQGSPEEALAGSPLRLSTDTRLVEVCRSSTVSHGQRAGSPPPATSCDGALWWRRSRQRPARSRAAIDARLAPLSPRYSCLQTMCCSSRWRKR